MTRLVGGRFRRCCLGFAQSDDSFEENALAVAKRRVKGSTRRRIMVNTVGIAIHGHYPSCEVGCMQRSSPRWRHRAHVLSHRENTYTRVPLNCVSPSTGFIRF